MFQGCTTLVADLTSWVVPLVENYTDFSTNNVIQPIWPFIFKFILNNPSTTNSTILDNLPIITNNILTLTSVIRLVGSYTVVNITAPPTDTSLDGISFYNGTNTKSLFFNNNTTAFEIVQFGSIPLSRNGSQFRELRCIINSIPKISSNTSLAQAFYNCSTFNSNISSWDTSNVTNMSSMFQGCTTFNQPLSWDVRNVIDMSGTFQGCESFNQPLSWTTTNVTNMSSMFQGCSSFNQQ